MKLNVSQIGASLLELPEKITVKIVRDDDPPNPRIDYDHLGTMACWHKRYKLGDVQPKEDPEAWLRDNAPKGSIVLPLYLYDHGGITISASAFSCRFDSGHVGYIICPLEKILEFFNIEKINPEAVDQVTKILLSEVKEYDDYLTGNVWGYSIETGDGEVIDSCFGFFGDGAIECMLDNVESEHKVDLINAWNKR